MLFKSQEHPEGLLKIGEVLSYVDPQINFGTNLILSCFVLLKQKELEKLKSKDMVWIRVVCRNGRVGFTPCILRRFESLWLDPLEPDEGMYAIQYAGQACHRECKLSSIEWYRVTDMEKLAKLLEQFSEAICPHRRPLPDTRY